jgi:hypothetical protein
MPWQQRRSSTAFEHRMNGQQFSVLVNADLVSQAVHVERALAGTVRHTVVVAADGYEPFMTDAPLEPDHTVKLY